MAQSGRGTGHSPANITRFLKGVDFPAKKDELVKQAQHNKADREVIDEIQKMQQGEYESMADVMKAYGQEEHGKSQSTQSRQSQSQSKPSQSKPSKSSTQQHRR